MPAAAVGPGPPPGTRHDNRTHAATPGKRPRPAEVQSPDSASIPDPAPGSHGSSSITAGVRLVEAPSSQLPAAPPEVAGAPPKVPAPPSQVSLASGQMNGAGSPRKLSYTCTSPGRTPGRSGSSFGKLSYNCTTPGRSSAAFATSSGKHSYACTGSARSSAAPSVSPGKRSYRCTAGQISPRSFRGWAFLALGSHFRGLSAKARRVFFSFGGSVGSLRGRCSPQFRPLSFLAHSRGLRMTGDSLP